MTEVPQCELWSGIVHWNQHVIFVSDGFWAHLAKAADVTWCGARALDVAEVDERRPCPKCMTLALAELPLDSELWRFYKRTRGGDRNATPSTRWCSTCGAARLGGAHCRRCD